MFHDVVKECVCIFDHRICALAEGEDTSCHQIVELLRLGGWPGLDVCLLPHSLRRCVLQFQPATLCGNTDGILEGGVGVSSGKWKSAVGFKVEVLQCQREGLI